MDAYEKIQLRKEAAEALAKKPKKKQEVHNDIRNPFGINWGITNKIKNVSTVGKVVNSVKSKFVGKTKTTKKF